MLTRMVDEAVVIDVPPSEGWTRVVVVHCGHRNRGVSLGFDAPREVEIYRSEVRARIEAERGEADPC